MNRITFRKQPRYSGMMRLPESYHANQSGKHIATLQRDSGDLWFWYGDGKNTAGDYVTLGECKQQVIAYFTQKHEKGAGV